LIAALLLLTLLPAIAQDDSGQVWVRAFLDQDGDGARDPGEPLLREGVFVELVRDDTVIAASALSEAEYAEQGLISFQNVPSGAVTLRMSALDGAPTTPTSAVVQVGAGGLPPVVDFGVSALDAVLTPAPSGFLASLTPRDPETMRLALSGLGAALTIGLTASFGFLILLLLRGRAPVAAPPRNARVTTGVVAVVDQGDTTGASPADRDSEATRS